MLYYSFQYDTITALLFSENIYTISLCDTQRYYFVTALETGLDISQHTFAATLHWGQRNAIYVNSLAR
jgi:hypothetical protein